MGKRTLHGMSYYHCDYTGFPITRAKCYLPYWDLDTNKMKKRNHYCNWEAALAHAEMLLHDGVITEHHYASIVAFVTDKIGGVSLKAAPKASELHHLNQTGCISTLQDFFRACVIETQQMVAVIIKANGELKEENFYVDLGHFDPTPKMEGAAPDDEVCFTHTPRRCLRDAKIPPAPARFRHPFSGNQGPRRADRAVRHQQPALEACRE